MRLLELATLFLRLGTIGFGGPAAHIALMEEEIVRRRGWMSRDAFLDLVGASQLIPGPNSTELAIHVGYARAGWPGLVVAGACFILPAMGIVWAIAWAYVRFGTLPAVGGALAGIKPVVLAVIALALVRLAGSALVSAMTLSIGGLAVLGLAFGLHEVLVLALAAGLAALDWRLTRGGNLWERGAPLVVPAPMFTSSAAGNASTNSMAGATTGAALGAALGGGAAVVAVSLGQLFLFFAKAGALLFGSGYVLIAFLRTDFVTRTGWLTEAQLMDAIAVGQFTPGPLFTTATFVGYVVAGNAGAVLATLGIFLPAFVFVALTAPVLHRFRTHLGVRATLGGLNAASLALMAVATLPLAIDALDVPWLGLPLFVTAFLVLQRTQVNSAWLIAGGALVGWGTSLF